MSHLHHRQLNFGDHLLLSATRLRVAVVSSDVDLLPNHTHHCFGSLFQLKRLAEGRLSFASWVARFHTMEPAFLASLETSFAMVERQRAFRRLPRRHEARHLSQVSLLPLLSAH